MNTKYDTLPENFLEGSRVPEHFRQCLTNSASAETLERLIGTVAIIGHVHSPSSLSLKVFKFECFERQELTSGGEAPLLI
jgi:hypothetical protein